ncbi:hypothetical protein BHE74_00007831 [Ensete ventricosum]|nr:hypothetical protein GW17_00020640 [Ensete ventricosum]RWW83649.1 hypothetical protein BHE74_00007831 [Ensete ventricosum]RZS26926.1 hypothetical protein BHM03_00060347 [Ensete ventricosum]
MEEQQQHIRQIKNSRRMEEDGEEESPRSALSSVQAREEEIERKKMEVKEKVFARLCRVEEESKHLAMIRGVRTGSHGRSNQERSGGITQEDRRSQSCIETSRTILSEKEALVAFDEKNKEKSQLVAKLMEVTLLSSASSFLWYAVD